MDLSNLKPAPNSTKKRKRIARGQGSGKGGTATRGHKGAKSRSGYSRKFGFEGGQMPLQRRLPKVGFNSRMAKYTAELTLNEIASVDADIVDINALHKANILPYSMKRAKVMLSGTIDKAVTLKGIRATKGARAAIEKAGGSLQE